MKPELDLVDPLLDLPAVVASSSRRATPFRVLPHAVRRPEKGVKLGFVLHVRQFHVPSFICGIVSGAKIVFRVKLETLSA